MAVLKEIAMGICECRSDLETVLEIELSSVDQVCVGVVSFRATPSAPVKRVQPL